MLNYRNLAVPAKPLRIALSADLFGKSNLSSGLQKKIAYGLVLVLALIGAVSTPTATIAAQTTSTTATLSFPQTHQGMWYNMDQMGFDGPILKVLITQNTIHAWQLCSPTLCDWGLANVVMLSPGVATVNYISSWGSVTLKFRIVILDYRTLVITTTMPWGTPNIFKSNFYRTTSG